MNIIFIFLCDILFFYWFLNPWYPSSFAIDGDPNEWNVRAALESKEQLFFISIKWAHTTFECVILLHWHKLHENLLVSSATATSARALTCCQVGSVCRFTMKCVASWKTARVVFHAAVALGEKFSMFTGGRGLFLRNNLSCQLHAILFSWLIKKVRRQSLDCQNAADNWSRSTRMTSPKSENQPCAM